MISSYNLSSLFTAVQASVIPLLLSTPTSRSLYPSTRQSDLCVSAPTGSGKTLSYVVPILEVLRTRQIRRLRALILLPTRDLVNQVRETLDSLNKGLGGPNGDLKVGICMGNSSFANEQNMLVEKRKNYLSSDLDEDEEDLDQGFDKESERREISGDGYLYSSKVDILLATPGRLIDHLKSTKGFNLKHLRFLIVDEADRLMGQSFQEWIGRLEDEIVPPNVNDEDFGEFEGEVQAPAWLKRDKDDLNQVIPSSVSCP